MWTCKFTYSNTHKDVNFQFLPFQKKYGSKKSSEIRKGISYPSPFWALATTQKWVMSSTQQHTQVASVMTEPLQPITSMDKLFIHDEIQLNCSCQNHRNQQVIHQLDGHTQHTRVDGWLVNYSCKLTLHDANTFVFVYKPWIGHEKKLPFQAQNLKFGNRKQLRINFIHLSCALFSYVCDDNNELLDLCRVKFTDEQLNIRSVKIWMILSIVDCCSSIDPLTFAQFCLHKLFIKLI